MMNRSMHIWGSSCQCFGSARQTFLRGIPTSIVGAVLWLVLAIVMGDSAHAQQKVIVVVGAEGESEYGKQFADWADNWESAVESVDRAKPELIRIGLDQTSQTDAELLKAEIESTPADISELWIVLIGHGTDDRTSSKFNLRGPDITATDLQQWLSPVTARVVVINCSSASGRFITKLASPNRVVVTATKSGVQHNFARFGAYLSTAIDNPANDLDKDGQTSLLEAFLAASAQTQEFYLQETRLATELAMIDDNGDGLGTPSDWFEGTRVVRESKSGEPDGLAANQVFLIRRGTEANLTEEQRQTRDELEQELELLRTRKSTMTEEGYYRAIEPVILKLAKFYQSLNQSQPVKPTTGDDVSSTR